MPGVGDEAWEAARNVLCIRLDSMGDVLMTTPAIRALREARSGRRITLLTSSSGGAIARLVPEIDEVLTYDAPWLKADASSSPDGIAAMATALRARAFDAAAIFTVFTQSALPAATLAFMAAIPLRIAHLRERAYQLLTHEVRDPEPGDGIRHEVERQLSLVEHAGATVRDRHLSLRVPLAARVAAAARLRAMGIADDEPFVVMHPGATAASRRYPPRHFAMAATQVAERTGTTICITGSEDERSLADDICRATKGATRNLAGELSLDELVAVIARASVLVTNNTGPAHIAAAVNTPVVVLYALTNPQHTPWMVPSRILSHDVACRWCFRSVCPEGHNHCLTMVAPERVADAACDLIAERTAPIHRAEHRGSGLTTSLA